MISGEGTAGTVRAVQAGREPHDEDAWPRGTEGRHRARPVVWVTPADDFEKPGEPRAARAVRVVGRGAGWGAAQLSHPCGE